MKPALTPKQQWKQDYSAYRQSQNIIRNIKYRESVMLAYYGNCFDSYYQATSVSIHSNAKTRLDKGNGLEHI